MENLVSLKKLLLEFTQDTCPTFGGTVHGLNSCDAVGKNGGSAVPRTATKLCKQSLSKIVLSRGQHAGPVPYAMGHRCRLAGQSGQASIEFVFIMVVVLLYLYSIIIPGIDVASSSARDVKVLSEAVFAGERLANSINTVSAGAGDGQMKVTLFVPEGASITYAASKLTVSVTLEQNATACGNTKVCVKSYAVFPLSGFPNLSGSQSFALIISKSGGNVSVSLAP